MKKLFAKNWQVKLMWLGYLVTGGSRLDRIVVIQESPSLRSG
ncbi:MAG TPA: hypothetical protein VNM35_01635 [Chitinophagaceae bacterium]|nr:hypothetical protein [Chitinophagaceae bacterium]